MKRNVFLALLTLVMAFNGYSQSMPDASPMVIEAQYLLPKRGMEDKFEAAIAAHNKKFHPAGPYVAGLRKIDYGPKTGWYVWVMGPTAPGSLDSRPAKEGGHDEDWKSTVDPLVDQYGPTNLYLFKSELSWGYDILRKSKHYEVWSVKLKDGQEYRFRDLCGKLKKVYEQMGTQPFVVLGNALHSPEGPDVLILWAFNSFGDYFKDDGTKIAYEKMYGDGSWQNMMDDWKSMIVDFSSEYRSVIF